MEPTSAAEDLAAELARTLDADPGEVLAHVLQHARDLETYDEYWDAGEFTEAGRTWVGRQVTEYFTSLVVDESIIALRAAVAALAEAERGAEAATARRDEAIRAALDALRPVRQLVEVTGLTRSRIYQIRDGRR